MLLVVDRPAIQYVVEEGLASGADEVVIVNSREKKAIEDHFTPNPELVALLRERGKDGYADAVAEAPGTSPPLTSPRAATARSAAGSARKKVNRNMRRGSRI